MQRLAERYGPDRLVVLAINFKESPGRVIRFTQSSGFTLPVLLDADGQLAGRWGVKIFPTTLLLDSQGLPQRRVKGEVDWMSPASFRLIDALLADSRPASKITLTQR